MSWIKEEKLYPVLVLLLIFIMAARVPLDSDMWWHLKAGEETLISGQVYSTDTFSLTRSGENWINHSWLSQVMMAMLFRMGEYWALSIWVALFAVLSMGLVYLQMEGNPLLRSAVLILAAIVSSVVWSPRPQIMSLVLLGLISCILYLYRKKRKWPYLAGVPLIFALWGNLHGGYVLGVIYIGAHIGGEILDKIMFRDSRQGLSWKEIRLVAITMMAGILLILLNPFGVEMWKIPFNTIGVETLQNLINEWSSPDFHQVFQQPFLWMLLGLIGALGLTGKPLKGFHLVPIVVFSWAALVARRNFGPFAIVCAPALAEQLEYLLQDWVHRVRQISPKIDEFVKSVQKNKKDFNITARNLLNVILIGLLLVTAVIKIIQVNDPELIAGTERDLFPAGAVEWLRDQEQGTRIFNDYNWGGYLIYHSPGTPVFVDGRTDLYGDEILSDYHEIMQAGKNWEEILMNYDLNTLLISNSSHLSQVAKLQGWAVVYRDDLAIILQSHY